MNKDTSQMNEHINEPDVQATVTEPLPPIDVNPEPRAITLKSRKMSVQLDAAVPPPAAGANGHSGPGHSAPQEATEPYAHAMAAQVFAPETGQFVSAPGHYVVTPPYAQAPTGQMLAGAGVGSPPMIPPGPVPPMAVPVPTPADPLLVRHRWKILFGALLVAALAAAAIVFIASRDGGDRDTAKEVLASSAQRVKRVLTAASQAEKTDGFAAVGSDAEAAAANLNALNVRLNEIGSSAMRTSVGQALTAETAVVAGLAGLKDMRRSQKALETWTSSTRSRVQTAASQLTAANAAIQGLELEDAAAVTVATTDVDSAVNHVDSVVGNAIDALRESRRARARANRKKRQLRSEGSALQSYGNSVVAVYNDYYSDRDKTQVFFRSVAPSIGPYGDHSISEAKSALEEYIRDRNDTISRLRAISLPAGMQGAHAGLISVVERSLDGLQAFNRAIEEYYNTPPSYGLTDSPSWTSAESISAQVTSAYTAARSAWEGQLGALMRKTQRNVSVPQLPDI